MELGACQLVAVLLADRDPDLSCLPHLGAHGFAGVMLDTADKARGALPDVMSLAALGSFVEAAHASGLFAGLAGSLRLEHVTQLSPLAPDLLGFRRALCEDADRTSALDPRAVRRLREAVSNPAGSSEADCFEHRAGAP
jgi:uncharacterized protein (UPF0264 family)